MVAFTPSLPIARETDGIAIFAAPLSQVQCCEAEYTCVVRKSIRDTERAAALARRAEKALLVTSDSHRRGDDDSQHRRRRCFLAGCRSRHAVRLGRVWRRCDP